MKRFFVFFVITLMSLAILTACGGETTTVASWSTSGGLTNDSQTESWHVSAGRINGHIRRDITFTQDSLSMLYVHATNSDGEMFLTFTQGDMVTTLNISGNFEGFLAMPGFEPGTIRVRLDFESAVDPDVFIRWAAGFFQ